MALAGILAGACSSGRVVQQGADEFSIDEEKYHEALSMASAGRYQESINAWKEVLADEPRWAMAHFNLGQLYDRLDQIPDAITCYERAVTLTPDVAVYHFNLGGAFFKVGRYEAAARCFKDALAKDPYNHLADFNLAGVYMSMKDYDTALVHADRAVDLYAVTDTRNESGLAAGVDRGALAKLLERQAECHIARGEMDKARQCVDRIVNQCRSEVPKALQLKLDGAADDKGFPVAPTQPQPEVTPEPEAPAEPPKSDG